MTIVMMTILTMTMVTTILTTMRVMVVVMLYSTMTITIQHGGDHDEKDDAHARTR